MTGSLWDRCDETSSVATFGIARRCILPSGHTGPHVASGLEWGSAPVSQSVTIERLTARVVELEDRLDAARAENNALGALLRRAVIERDELRRRLGRENEYESIPEDVL